MERRRIEEKEDSQTDRSEGRKKNQLRPWYQGERERDDDAFKKLTDSI